MPVMLYELMLAESCSFKHHRHVIRVQIALTVQGEKGKRRETIIDSCDVRTLALGFRFYQAVVEEIFRSFTEVKVAILHWEVLSAGCF